MLAYLLLRYHLWPLGSQLSIRLFELLVIQKGGAPFAVVPCAKVVQTVQHSLTKCHYVGQASNLLFLHVVG